MMPKHRNISYIHTLSNMELLILSLAVQLEIKHRLAISHPLTGKTDAPVQVASQHAQNQADAPATSETSRNI